MAVAIDAICVVIPNGIVETRYPGGIAAYERDCPNATYCSDGRICRVAFMVEADALAFVDRLTSYGFKGPSSGQGSEMAVVAQHVNRLQPCDWLEMDLRAITVADGRQFGTTIAWLQGDTLATVAAPVGWKPGTFQIVPAGDLRHRYEFLGATGGDSGRVETYRQRDTEQLLHIGRPKIPAVPDVQTRYLALLNELKDLEEQQPRTGRHQTFASFSERATQLVKDTHAQEPGPLLLQGMAARLLKQWELAAESARAVTVLRPDLINGWLDLTWACGELGRLDEAESCARRAVAIDGGSEFAWGNLASVLVQRGDVEEAFTTITRALEIDPANGKNQAIREHIREARDQHVSKTRAPWYRRLWGQ